MTKKPGISAGGNRWGKEKPIQRTGFPQRTRPRAFRPAVHDLIQDISTCIAARLAAQGGRQWLRQPVLLAYLVGGFLIGPQGLKWVIHRRRSTSSPRWG